MWKNIVKQRAYAPENPNARLKAWYIAGSLELHIDGLLQNGFVPFVFNITAESYKQLYDKSKLWNLDDKVLQLYIKMIGNTNGFKNIDSLFEKAIEPFLQVMTATHFNLLLQEMDRNSQVYNNYKKKYMVNQVEDAYNQKFATQLNLQPYTNLV